jgi:hypothetical protein
MHNPHLTEELWTLVGRQILDVKDWARVAGTCKAAWRAQYAGKLAVRQDLPVEGAMLDGQHEVVQTTGFFFFACLQMQSLGY